MDMAGFVIRNDDNEVAAITEALEKRPVIEEKDFETLTVRQEHILGFKSTKAYKSYRLAKPKSHRNSLDPRTPDIFCNVDSPDTWQIALHSWAEAVTSSITKGPLVEQLEWQKTQGGNEWATIRRTRMDQIQRVHDQLEYKRPCLVVKKDAAATFPQCPEIESDHFNKELAKWTRAIRMVKIAMYSKTLDDGPVQSAINSLATAPDKLPQLRSYQEEMQWRMKQWADLFKDPLYALYNELATLMGPFEHNYQLPPDISMAPEDYTGLECMLDFEQAWLKWKCKVPHWVKWFAGRIHDIRMFKQSQKYKAAAANPKCPVMPDPFFRMGRQAEWNKALHMTYRKIEVIVEPSSEKAEEQQNKRLTSIEKKLEELSAAQSQGQKNFPTEIQAAIAKKRRRMNKGGSKNTTKKIKRQIEVLKQQWERKQKRQQQPQTLEKISQDECKNRQMGFAKVLKEPYYIEYLELVKDMDAPILPPDPNVPYPRPSDWCKVLDKYKYEVQMFVRNHSVKENFKWMALKDPSMVYFDEDPAYKDAVKRVFQLLSSLNGTPDFAKTIAREFTTGWTRPDHSMVVKNRREQVKSFRKTQLYSDYRMELLSGQKAKGKNKLVPLKAPFTRDDCTDKEWQRRLKTWQTKVEEVMKDIKEKRELKNRLKPSYCIDKVNPPHSFQQNCPPPFGPHYSHPYAPMHPNPHHYNEAPMHPNPHHHCHDYPMHPNAPYGVQTPFPHHPNTNYYAEPPPLPQETRVAPSSNANSFPASVRNQPKQNSSTGHTVKKPTEAPKPAQISVPFPLALPKPTTSSRPQGQQQSSLPPNETLQPVLLPESGNCDLRPSGPPPPPIISSHGISKHKHKSKDEKGIDVSAIKRMKTPDELMNYVQKKSYIYAKALDDRNPDLRRMVNKLVGTGKLTPCPIYNRDNSCKQPDVHLDNRVNRRIHACALCYFSISGMLNMHRITDCPLLNIVQ